MKKIPMRKIRAIRTKPGQATPQFNTTSTLNSGCSTISLNSKWLLQETAFIEILHRRPKLTLRGKGVM